MEDADDQLLIGVVCSLISITGLIMAAVLCSWCFGKDKYDSDEEEDLPVHEYKPVPFHDDPRGGQSAAARQAAVARQTSVIQDANGTKKSIKYDRSADKKLVAEHVQPANQHSQSGHLHSASTHQVVAHSQQTEVQAAGAANNSDEDGSMWKGMRSLANRLIDDIKDDAGDNAATVATATVIEGQDYKLGRIQFKLGYDFQSLTLTLTVFRSVGLPAKDFSGTSDPYVKVLLLPDKKHKLLTKVKKRNLNPHWNERFVFEGWPHNKLLEKTIYMQVIDYDRFSRDDPIGEVYIPLNEVDLSLTPTMWKYLQPCKDSRGRLGEVLLSLCYQPSIGRLTIVVMKAKDLKAKDITGASDPYVKLWLMNGINKVEKKKTSIKRRTLNPVYNETFIFEIPWDKIREAKIDVTVMDFDKLGRNELIGKLILGSRSGPTEMKHWNDMIAKPRQQVAQWHILKD